MSVKLSGRTLSFVAPGDDLLCGKAKRYELFEPQVIAAGGGSKRTGAAAAASLPAPVAAGQPQSFTLPGTGNAAIGIRAVDDQGNAGPVALFRKPPAGGGHSPRLRLTVSPRSVDAGHQTRFRFRVTSSGGAVSGALIRFAGRRVTTDSAGRASIVATIERRGHHTAIATRGGYVAGRAVVAVRRLVDTRFTG
jgi:hypothetical protein